MTSDKKENQKSSDFLKRRQEIRNDVNDVIKLAQTRMIIQYDAKHKSSNLSESVYLKMRKTDSSDYHLLKSFSLSIKKIDSFKILTRINDLTY